MAQQAVDTGPAGPGSLSCFKAGSTSSYMVLAALGVLLASHTSLVALMETYMYYSQSLVVLVGLLVLPAGRAVFTITLSSPKRGGAAACSVVEVGKDEAACAQGARAGGEGVAQCAESTACSSQGSAAGAGAVAGAPRGRRGPRLSVQLTPLPRVTLEFDGRRGARPGGAVGARPPRWQAAGGRASFAQGLPPLALGRHAPGHAPDLLPSPSLRAGAWRAAAASPFAAAAGGDAAAADGAGAVVDGRELSGVVAAPGEATASLGTDDLPADCGGAVAASVGEAHLLQFGAMLGERSCVDALAAAEGAGPVGSTAHSLYGAADTDAFYAPWEAVVEEAAPGLRYWGWRRPLRRGLFMYMTRSVFLGVTPSELRSFMMDDACRLRWDKSMAALGPALAGARGGGAAGAQRESDVLYAAVRFPKPLGQRSYVYARRVWARPGDGGCYVLARAAPPPGGAPPPPRGVVVGDYCSGAVIRAPDASVTGGHSGPAAEVLMIYFEDSHVRAGFANIGIKKGLWPMLQRTDRALRAYLASGGAPAFGGSGCDGGAASEPATPRAAPAACGKQQAPVCSGGGGGGVSVLGSITGALRALAAAAGMLWEAHGRVASLLPRMELRVLRWLASAIASGGAAALSWPPPPAAAAAAALRRVGSHPLGDLAPAAGAPRLPRVRVVAPAEQLPGAVPAAAAAATSGGAAPRAALQRVGSHPLTAEDLAALESLDAADAPPGAPPAAAAPPRPLARAPSAPAPCVRCERCGSAPGVGGDWPVARFVAAAAFEPRGGGGAPRCSGGYAASCPAGSCAGSVSGASAATGQSAAQSGGCSGGGRPRRRAGGRLVVRLIQAASVRVAHKLLSSADGRVQ